MGSGVSTGYSICASDYAFVEEAVEKGDATWQALPPPLQGKMNGIVAFLENQVGEFSFEEKGHKGDVIALHNLALLLSRGTGIQQDDKKAVELWKEASRQGHVESTYNLAEMLHENRGVKVAANGNPYFNQFKAVALWTQCTRRPEGHAKSERRLAEAYTTGVGVIRADQAKATEHYAKATNQSVAKAWAEIGEMHEKGTGGFVKNENAAAKRYSISAETGNPKALFQLGKMYMDGRGVSKDKEKGEALLANAIEAGHTEAQYHQAILIARRDPFKAIALLNRAARNGHGRAKEQLERVKAGEKIKDDDILPTTKFGRALAKISMGLHKEPPLSETNRESAAATHEDLQTAEKYKETAPATSSGVEETASPWQQDDEAPSELTPPAAKLLPSRGAQFLEPASPLSPLTPTKSSILKSVIPQRLQQQQQTGNVARYGRL